MSALAGRLRAASSLLANRYKVLSAISVFTSYKIKNEKIPLSHTLIHVRSGENARSIWNFCREQLNEREVPAKMLKMS